MHLLHNYLKLQEFYYNFFSNSSLTSFWNTARNCHLVEFQFSLLPWYKKNYRTLRTPFQKNTPARRRKSILEMFMVYSWSHDYGFLSVSSQVPSLLIFIGSKSYFTTAGAFFHSVTGHPVLQSFTSLVVAFLFTLAYASFLFLLLFSWSLLNAYYAQVR